jgi:hypothetical protein
MRRTDDGWEDEVAVQGSDDPEDDGSDGPDAESHGGPGSDGEAASGGEEETEAKEEVNVTMEAFKRLWFDYALMLAFGRENGYGPLSAFRRLVQYRLAVYEREQRERHRSK